MLKPAELCTHTQLRRCLAFLLFIIIPYNSFALNACVENDTVAIVLDPNITGSGGGRGNFNNSTQTWNVQFSYGTIYGIAACLSSNYGMPSYGTYIQNNGVLIDNGQVVKGGEANGNYCWCKLTYPVVSYWVYDSNYGYADAAECTRYGTTQNGCAQRCSGHVGNGTNGSGYKIRYALFNAI